MKRYHGSHDAGHPTCQTLGQIRGKAGCEIATGSELAIRIHFENQHDPCVSVADRDEVLQVLAAEYADRCPCCGELSRGLVVCPGCKSPLWVPTENRKSG